MNIFAERYSKLIFNNLLVKKLKLFHVFLFDELGNSFYFLTTLYNTLKQLYILVSIILYLFYNALKIQSTVNNNFIIILFSVLQFLCNIILSEILSSSPKWPGWSQDPSFRSFKTLKKKN